MQRRTALLAFVACWFIATVGRADDPQQLSDYERQSVEEALTREHAELEEQPEGKIVEAVEVVTLPVIEKRDPAPGFLNVFHAETKPYIVGREVLLHPGDVYDQTLVRESERNLRVRQLSVVVIVPVKGSRPNTVRLLVVTKDIWSLRLNSDPQIVNGKLTYLYLQPAEENLFGLHKTASAQLTLTRTTYSAGLGYVDPRVAGSRIRGTLNANLIFNCETNKPEGSFGNLRYGKPLYSPSRTKWAWIAAIQWSQRTVRPAGSSGDSVCSGGRSALLDFASTPELDAVPYEYEADTLNSQFSAARSFGTVFKTNFSFGLESERTAYSAPGLEALSPAVQRAFQSLLPTSDTRVSPFLMAEWFRNEYHRTVNVENLALQEDFRMGHDVRVRIYPAAKAVGSSRNLLGIYAGLAYTVPLKSGFWRGFAESTTEVSTLDKTDAAFRVGMRLVSPSLGIGHLIYDGYLLNRYVNYLNPVSALGGTGRLRGYRPVAAVGPDVVASNIEFRTLPLELFSLQFAAAAFWDMGDAFRGFDDLKLLHGYGGGIRFLAPQVDRTVLRVDVGVPLDPKVPGAELTVVAQFSQAFGVPSLNPPGLVQLGQATAF